MNVPERCERLWLFTEIQFVQLARCETEEEGDALSWSKETWNISGEVAWTVRETQQVCERKTRRILIFPNRFSLKAGLHLCKVVGGRIAVPQSTAENIWLYNVTQQDAEYCTGGQGSNYLWLGATDQWHEGQWQYWDSGQTVPWIGPWRGSGPNGGVVENCLVLQTVPFMDQWSDIACLDTYEFCVPCEFISSPVLYLRGPAVCPTSPFNRQYALVEKRGGKLALDGYLHSDIFWDPNNSTWVIKSLKEAGAAASWKPSDDGKYPLGTNTWVLAGKLCGMKPGEEVNLTLSVCETGEFTCADGSCIKLFQRCDLRIDCPDQSDEAQCSVVEAPDSYRKTIPPPSIVEGKPLDIFFMIDLTSFPSIATQDLTFITNLNLKLRWQDVRLTYKNLHNDSTLNLLTSESIANLWTPRVFFSNAQGNVFTNLDQGAHVECIRQAPSKPAPPEFTHEMNIFSGRENSMEMGQLYTVTHSCDFNLLMFPFDAQVCSLYFTLVSAASTYMVLVPFAANYSGPKNLIEYTIGEVSMLVKQDGEFSSVGIKVRFYRRYGFYLLTLYIPTTLLIVIAYASFFFNPEDFNSRITVALTALLVLASLFTQTSNSLPKTSYFKLVDVWLFFSIVIIFFVVMLQTLVDFAADKNWFSCLSNKKSTKIQVLDKTGRRTKEAFMGPSFPRVAGQYDMAVLNFSRIIIPILFFIFNIIYWASAIRYLLQLDM
ncbi:uncharacterized protein [Cherax quadricarinatus]|uniref:uncharacterized protein n=1 Tax=Cherax quadricarinatus TaxID=27406 RepID=UPI00387E22F4